VKTCGGTWRITWNIPSTRPLRRPRVWKAAWRSSLFQANEDARDLWAAVRPQLQDTRVEDRPRLLFRGKRFLTPSQFRGTGKSDCGTEVFQERVQPHLDHPMENIGFNLAEGFESNGQRIGTPHVVARSKA
jgi:hypothetical protein